MRLGKIINELEKLGATVTPIERRYEATLNGNRAVFSGEYPTPSGGGTDVVFFDRIEDGPDHVGMPIRSLKILLGLMVK